MQKFLKGLERGLRPLASFVMISTIALCIFVFGSDFYHSSVNSRGIYFQSYPPKTGILSFLGDSLFTIGPQLLCLVTFVAVFSVIYALTKNGDSSKNNRAD